MVTARGIRSHGSDLEVLVEVLEQVAQAGLGRADAEAEERQRRLGDDRVGDAEGRGDDDGRQRRPAACAAR